MLIAAGCLTFGLAGLVTFGGIIMMHLMAGEPGHVLGIAAIIGLCWLAAFGLPLDFEAIARLVARYRGYGCRWSIVEPHLERTGRIGMNWRRMFGLSAAAAVGMALSPQEAVAQKSLKEQLIGSWYLVTQIQERPDGRKEEFYGPNPKGINIFSADGRFAVIFTRSDLPKLTGGDRRTATAEESRAILMGTIAYFGTYEVNEADRTILYKSEGTTFPNQGPTATRLITVLNADELRYRNPKVTSGGQLEVILRRAK